VSTYLKARVADSVHASSAASFGSRLAETLAGVVRIVCLELGLRAWLIRCDDDELLVAYLCWLDAASPLASGVVGPATTVL